MATFTHRKFIAAVAVISILITGFGAAQAQAQPQNRNAERALAAIVGLAVIGAIIANKQDDDRTQTQPVIRPAPTLEARPLPRDLRPNKSHAPFNRPYHKVSRRELPQTCLRESRTRNGVARYFSARCMSRNYRHVNRLPDHCERQIRTDRGIRYGWGARCLRREGYTLARY